MVVITVNDIPLAVDDVNSTNENTPVSGNLSTNDTPSVDGGNTWSLVNNALNGNVVVDTDGTYTYTPNAGFSGADTFYYKVCDIDGDCDTAIAIIQVTVTTPIKDLFLTANAPGSKLVNISWRVSCESDVKYYILERSTDGLRFETTTQVQSNSICTPQTYKFADQLQVPFTTLYYRVKAIEMNGQIYYSNIVRIQGTLQNNVIVSPNPFIEKINIEFIAKANEKVNAQILTTEGKLLKSITWISREGYNQNLITELGQLPRGNYLVNLLINNKIIQSQIIIKN
jgi:hypothetical protein